MNKKQNFRAILISLVFVCFLSTVSLLHKRSEPKTVHLKQDISTETSDLPLDEAKSSLSTDQISSLISQKVDSIRYCPCLAEEHATQQLLDYGIDSGVEKTTAESLSNIKNKFENYLIQSCSTFPVDIELLLNQSFFLLDKNIAGNYELYIFYFNTDGGVASWVLSEDDDCISDLQKSPQTLSGITYSDCFSGHSKSTIQTLEGRIHMLDKEINGQVWRVCKARKAEYALIAFSVDPTAEYVDIHVFYPTSQISEHVNLNCHAPKMPNLSELNHRLLEIKIDDSFALSDDEAMLRSFLIPFLLNTDTPLPWDLPAVSSPDYYEYYSIKNALVSLIREMHMDEALLQRFLRSTTWTLSRVSGSIYSITAEYIDGTTEIAIIYPAGVDVSGCISPSRANLFELAHSGYGSNTVPDEIVNQFVDYTLSDIQFGYEWAGIFGSSEWSWSTSNNQYILHVKYTPEECTQHNHCSCYSTLTAHWEDGLIYFDGIQSTTYP